MAGSNEDQRLLTIQMNWLVPADYKVYCRLITVNTTLPYQLVNEEWCLSKEMTGIAEVTFSS